MTLGEIRRFFTCVCLALSPLISAMWHLLVQSEHSATRAQYTILCGAFCREIGRICREIWTICREIWMISDSYYSCRSTTWWCMGSTGSLPEVTIIWIFWSRRNLARCQSSSTSPAQKTGSGRMRYTRTRTTAAIASSSASSAWGNVSTCLSSGPRVCYLIAECGEFLELNLGFGDWNVGLNLWLI